MQVGVLSSFIRSRYGIVQLIVASILLFASAVVTTSASALEPPYEFDPTLSLTGDCATTPFDPVPDPSCNGQPLAYPPPPNGPVAPFDEPRAIAIDAFGNEYVASWDGPDKDGRIDIFDDEGKFITEVAAPNAQSIAVDSKGTLYVFEDEVSFSDPESEVVRYEPSEYEFDEETEEWKIQYGNPPVIISSGSFIGALAVDPSPARLDQLLVVRAGNITRFKPAAEGNGVIAGPDPLPSIWPYGFAIDGQRERIFVSFCSGSSECAVKVLEAEAPYSEIAEINGSTTPAEEFVSDAGRLGIAVDEETGQVFVTDMAAKRVYEFVENEESEEYEYLSEFKLKDLSSTTSVQTAVSNGTRSLAGEPCEYPDPETMEILPGDACNRHYLFIPLLKSEGTGRAVAFHPSGQTPPVIEGVATAGIGENEAGLRAMIDSRGLGTEYHFEITTQEAWESETEKFKGATIVPGGTIPASSLATEVSVFATGLTPGETYRFRAVAENELGPAEEEGQNEAVFATYDDAPIISGCPNEVFRVGPSALLPDCRAYELVTPADTSARSPKGAGFIGSMFPTLQASPAGEAVSFKIEGGSLPGSSGIGSFEGDPYVSRRSPSGWNVDLAGATGDEATISAPGSTSPDQSYAFWRARGEGPLGPVGAIYAEYIYYPDGHSEPIGRGSEGVDFRARGDLLTENATHVIFETGSEASTLPVKLEPNAPPTGTAAVYDRTIDQVTGEEKTHVVSLFPGDETPKADENATYRSASEDGEGIAFSIGDNLYLRVGNETTYELGEEVEPAGVSEGGERGFYLEEGDLKALDTATPTPEVVDFTTTGNVTPVNVSNDGTRAYFVSPSVLGGTNPEGDAAEPGEQNLYLSEEGDISFVATVTDLDVSAITHGVKEGLGLWTEVVGNQVARDPSRLNPDGSVILFQSRAEITSYPESEFPQIYRFDSDAGELQCISCISTQTPATGGASLESYTNDSETPQPFSPYGFVPNLTPDGNRAFFESTEALVSTDTNGVNDVYEWEAQGVGGCKRPQGCVYLISSGQSEVDNFLYGHSTSGRDVFFTTGDRLTGWDNAGGAISIYDARINGGFPEPKEAEVCIGDGCRPTVTPAPAFERPRAGGDGDVVKPKPCSKGKRKLRKNGKVRCVKKKMHRKSKKNRRAGQNRGAGK